MTDTQLSRMLSATERRPDALTAFRIARRWFKDGRRIEMQELAAELGVNRATLFRWVGNRDDLLAEIIWSLAAPTLAKAIDGASARGGRRIAEIMGRFATMLDGADYFREFLRREPERALRVMTTRVGTVQQRLVSAVEALLDEEIAQGSLQTQLPPHTLAYLIVRIIESFVYSDTITGEQLDIASVELAITALAGQDPTADA
jgi:AcrR family transcriptional regulator